MKHKWVFGLLQTAERERAGSNTAMETVNGNGERANGEPHFLLRKDPTADEKMSSRVRREGRGRKGRKAAAELILIFCQRD